MDVLSIVLLFISAGVFALSVIATARRRRGEKLIFFTIWLFIAILFYLAAVGFGLLAREESVSGWDVLLIFPDAIVKALQHFTMNIAPADFITESVAVFENSAIRALFFILSSIYFIASPATGGIIIFNVACEIFPDFKFKWDNHSTKFIFSELNEYTITLAESIRQKQAEVRKSFDSENAEGKYLYDISITFTNAMPKSEADAATFSEYAERAKDIGANCLKKDFKTLAVKRPSKVIYNIKRFFSAFRINKATTLTYFLFGKDESENIKDAIFCADGSEKVKESWKKFDKVQLHVLSNNDEADEIISASYKQIKRQIPSVSVQVVREYANLVYNLLDSQYSLFFSKFGAKHEGKDANGNGIGDSLSVVVIGGGGIGKQFIKAAFWCGQTLDASAALKKRPFKISVISDNAEQVKKQLKFDMPQAFASGCEEYGNLSFYPDSFGTEGFYTDFEKCLDADYVLVALGNDNLNILATRWVARKLNAVNVVSGKRPVINFVIENEELCCALRKENGAVGAVLNPFGCLSERFGYDNVFLSELENLAFVMNSAYGGNAKNTWSSFVSDAYSRKSSMATAVHYKYKLASIGAIQSKEEWQNFSGDAVLFKVKSCLDEADCRNKLYYIEHMRWNAYMITEGYRCPTVDEFLNMAFGYLPYQTKAAPAVFKTHKDTALKLHSCLIACNDLGITLTDADYDMARLAVAEFVTQTPQTQNLGEWLLSFTEKLQIKNADGTAKAFDELDGLSLFISAYKGGKTDYKDYDFTMASSVYLSSVSRKIMDLYKNKDDDGVSLQVKLLYDALAAYQTAGVTKISAQYFQRGEGFNYSHIGAANGLDYVMVDDLSGNVCLFVYQTGKTYSYGGMQWDSEGGQFIRPCPKQAEQADQKPEKAVRAQVYEASAYYPSPESTLGIELGEEIDALAEKIAQNTHDVWAMGKISEGWRYGKKFSKLRKKTPQLVDYSKLSEAEKDYDRRTSQEALRLIKKLGFDIVKADSSKKEPEQK